MGEEMLQLRLKNTKLLEWALFPLSYACIQSPINTKQLQSSTKYTVLVENNVVQLE